MRHPDNYRSIVITGRGALYNRLKSSIKFQQTLATVLQASSESSKCTYAFMLSPHAQYPVPANEHCGIVFILVAQM